MKILVIRFSSIGDIVLTTPVVRCLKKQLNCEVHYATKKGFVQILEPNPYIDKVIPLGDSYGDFMDALKEEKYDLIIDLHKNLRTRRIKLLLGVKSFSFDKLNLKKWLLVKTKKNSLPNIHIVDRYMNTVESLGVKNDMEGLDYFVTEEYKEDLPEHFYVYAIGGQHETKKLPLDKMIELCNSLNAPTLLLGGKEDEENGVKIIEECEHVVNLCGKTSLAMSADIISKAHKVYTHDTGMMHVAAAFNKPIISIWGNTVPEFGMYPYYKNNTVPKDSAMLEVKGLACRPCSKIGFDKCPRDHFKCMNDIVISENEG